MSSEKIRTEQHAALQRDNYTINSLDDEISADKLCCQLLQQFHQFLLKEARLQPLEAAALASGADYFLRDFVISNRRANIFSTSGDTVRRFGGHWYILNNLEPNLTELKNLLMGIKAFSHFCASLQLVEDQQAAAVDLACQDLDFYRQRIESFLDLTGDGFIAWETNFPDGQQ